MERVEGVHGDADQIARHRTLLRFYAPFHRPSVVDDAIASMRSSTDSGQQRTTPGGQSPGSPNEAS
ncbi:hypothetical protein J2X20_002125 [Pelomonas saccharophila]|uniref:Uncharacterized protein n=1 Tax=Roseateles saccharophilus TaxID=304 RepID=A0ABU1YMP8_ROSSA|nr:hypothetical protein [Roseateles saccharophilus]